MYGREIQLREVLPESGLVHSTCGWPDVEENGGKRNKTERSEMRVSKRWLHPQREVETTQLSIDGRGDTQNVAHADGGVVLSQEKGRTV